MLWNFPYENNNSDRYVQEIIDISDVQLQQKLIPIQFQFCTLSVWLRIFNPARKDGSTLVENGFVCG